MFQRRRFEQPQSLKDRWLAAFAKKMREEASLLPPGTEHEDMLRKVSQADTAAHLDEWANSPGCSHRSKTGPRRIKKRANRRRQAEATGARRRSGQRDGLGGTYV
jgi:hypothetical protein